MSLVQWSMGIWLPTGVSALVALYTLARNGSLRMLGWAPPQRNDEGDGEGDQDAGRQLGPGARVPERAVGAAPEQGGQADQDDGRHHRGVEQPRVPAVQPLPTALVAQQTPQEWVRPRGVEPEGRRNRCRPPGGVAGG
ncbi:hypothetical protein ABZ379_12840 [Streptomyces canus]|uniref:hypothetical protein n=1 Tax=Streptomyces canus TaxID=58343 RepID=UPI0033ED091E